MVRPRGTPEAASFHSLALMLRGRAALTQRELAASIGVSDRAIQVWEAGLGYPSAASLQRLIALYLSRGAFSLGTETEEAATLWSAALAAAPRLKTAFDSEWFARLIGNPVKGSQAAPNAAESLRQPTYRDDWGDAPAVSAFHGRVAERDLLASWLVQDACRAVGIFGMGGIGKTALAAQVAMDLAPQFDTVYWRSLRNAPPCANWLADAILFLSQQQSVPPDGEEARLRRLLELLRERRCLLVLDNLEMVLEPYASQLSYREGYAGYGMVLQAVGEASHRSCVVVTSREQPPELARLEGPGGPVRALRLGGLDDEAGQALLADKGLVGSASSWGALVRTYAGNALALQVVAELIARVFGGDIAAFLSTGEAVFGDIRRLLQTQVERLSTTERAVLYWLALERVPVDFNTLAADLGPRVPRHDILEALQALDRRSLLEEVEGEATFTLQQVVLEHTTEEIISTALAEINSGVPVLLESHALVKAQTNEYVRRSQERGVAMPVLERLAVTKPRETVYQSLMDLVERWRGLPDAEQGFGPGNVVNLLRLYQGHLRRLDLSRLVLRQPDLSAVDLQDSTLAHSRLEDAIVAQQLGAAVSAALSVDGTSLAVGTVAGEVRVWRVAHRAPMLLERQPAGPAWGIALAAHGELVVSCGGPDGIWLRRTDGGTHPSALAADARELWCVALSADGRFVAGGGIDGAARIWDTRSGDCIHTFECHRGGVRGLALSHDGHILATGGADGGVGVWQLGARVQLMNMRTYSIEARAIALSADGSLVANGDADGVVHVRDARTGKPRILLAGHTGPIWAVALSSDAALLASGGADRTVRLWDTRTGRCQRVLHEHTAGVMMTSLSGDGRLVASVALDGSVRVWDTARGECLVTPRGNVPAVYDVALSGDGQRAVSGDSDGTVRVWDTASGLSIRALSGHSASVWGVALSPDGELVVSGGLDATVRVWSITDGKCHHVLTGHTLGVTSVALSPDRRVIASGSFDGTVRLWDAVTGDCLRVEQCGVAGVRTVRFSATGHLLISGELEGTARVWKAREGTSLQVMKGDACELNALALSADGHLVLNAGRGGRVRFWNAVNGECVRTVQAQTAGVKSLALSADGKLMLSGGVDGTVQVWDVDRGQQRDTLRGHSSEVWGVALNRDNRFAISAGLDGTLRVWDLASGGVELRTMRPDRPYERMDITGIMGISEIQRNGLLALGAVAA